MDDTRRGFLKMGIAAATAAAVGFHLPAHLVALGQAIQDGW